ncbi:hypothetical protein G7Y89_g10515 [Cudoniella acicularis]|uniref:Zn(2)-C6 fungal-type domain-containing protein n=1 Tax=Cudoniella acicularis TaxID=354080 RepID=A0A8H4VYY9_9HELO|nr:hypothetical protein G7Y89_g10515 [Cudoniella acicularis]
MDFLTSKANFMLSSLTTNRCTIIDTDPAVCANSYGFDFYGTCAYNLLNLPTGVPGTNPLTDSLGNAFTNSGSKSFTLSLFPVYTNVITTAPWKAGAGIAQLGLGPPEAPLRRARRRVVQIPLQNRGYRFGVLDNEHSHHTVYRHAYNGRDSDRAFSSYSYADLYSSRGRREIFDSIFDDVSDKDWLNPTTAQIVDQVFATRAYARWGGPGEKKHSKPRRTAGREGNDPYLARIPVFTPSRLIAYTTNSSHGAGTGSGTLQTPSRTVKDRSLNSFVYEVPLLHRSLQIYQTNAAGHVVSPRNFLALSAGFKSPERLSILPRQTVYPVFDLPTMKEAASGPGFLSTETLSKSLEQYSCALCHRRKVRCDKKNPCTYCAKHHVPCVPAASAATRPRKKRFPEAELLARLKRYEDALKSYGANLESINDIHSSSSLGTIPSKGANSTSTEEETLLLLTRELTHETHESGVKNKLGEMEKILKGESGEKSEQSPIITTYGDACETDSSTILFNLAGSVDLASLHPKPVQIFTLWQAFLDNVQPILRTLHAPTVQQQILRSTSNLLGASPAVHALLFSIYSNALLSMRDNACLAALNADSLTLVSRYTKASQYALQKAGFLRTSDLVVLQAFVLHLVSIMKTTDPLTFLSLTAIAERIAKRNGLHRNVQDYGLSAFERELQKRLWWQIILLDGRAAEMSAVGTTILSFAWNTELPLNVNESDLSSEMGILPQRYKRATDMTFCLIRCEIAEFLRQIRATRAIDIRWGEFSNPSVPLADKLGSINDFEQRLQTKYLSYCGPENPLHILARYYVKYSISKMRIAAYGPQMGGENQENLMHVCLEAIEAYTECAAEPSLVRFRWFLTASTPFLAYVILLSNLRYRPTGKLADRAWEAVTTVTNAFDRPRSSPFEPGDSVIKLSFESLSVKAWEAREAALKNDLSLNTPPLIAMMREKLVRIKGQHNMLFNGGAASNLINGNTPACTSNQAINLGSTSTYTGGMTNLTPPGALLPTPMDIMESSYQQVIPVNDELAMWDYWNTLLPGSGTENDMDRNQEMAMRR